MLELYHYEFPLPPEDQEGHKMGLVNHRPINSHQHDIRLLRRYRDVKNGPEGPFFIPP